MNLIGRKVTIKKTYEWGIIKGTDNGSYLIALFDGKEQIIFDRSEFTISRIKK